MKFLYKKVLQKALARNAPAQIPRSGDEVKSVNCFSVAVDSGEKPYFLADEIKGDEVKGRFWQHDSYKKNGSLSINHVQKKNLRITHFYRNFDTTFTGALVFALNYFTGWAYIKLWAYEITSNLDLFFFSKKDLITKSRMELLAYLVDSSLEEKDGKTLFGVMTGLYSIRWVSHPARDQQRNKVQLYLDALVETGDLRVSGSGLTSKYEVTGKAISSLELYEKEEIRHGEEMSNQRRMFWLTIVLAIIAIVQAGVVKLPVLFDFS